MADKFKTLPAAMSKLENAKRVMGREYLYRIQNAPGRDGFYIACYSAPLKGRDVCKAIVIDGLRVSNVDGQARAFLGFY